MRALLSCDTVNLKFPKGYAKQQSSKNLTALSTQQVRYVMQQSYCASDILTCKPPLVFVIGKEVLIFGMLRFCSKYNLMLTLLLTI